VRPEREDASCRKAGRWLTQREAPGDGRLEAHLERCADCRELARFVEQMHAVLTASAEIAPPPRVERVTRSRLLAGTIATPTVIRPAMAAGLAAAGLFAGVTGLAAVLALDIGDLGPVLAVIAAGVYLALSTVATLPLLVRTRMRPPAESLEVRS